MMATTATRTPADVVRDAADALRRSLDAASLSYLTTRPERLAEALRRAKDFHNKAAAFEMERDSVTEQLERRQRELAGVEAKLKAKPQTATELGRLRAEHELLTRRDELRAEISHFESTIAGIESASEAHQLA